MQECAVTDCTAAPNLEGDALVGVEDAMFLNVGLVAYFEKLVVAAKHRSEPDGDIAAQGHLADDIGVRRDPEVANGGKFWRYTIESQYWHGEARQPFRSSARMAI